MKSDHGVECVSGSTLPVNTVKSSLPSLCWPLTARPQHFSNTIQEGQNNCLYPRHTEVSRGENRPSVISKVIILRDLCSGLS